MAPPAQWRLRALSALGAFFVVRNEHVMGRNEMSELESKRYIEAGTDASPEAALEFADSVAAKIVDLKFTDLLGTWQHVSRSMSSFSSDDFDEGLGFDGSSIRGWQGIQESDMLLVPQADTATLAPFTADPALSPRCDGARPPPGGRSCGRCWPRSRASRTRRTRAASRAAPRSTWSRPASPTRSTS